MISAPLRPSTTLETKPSMKTQGHLALLEWDQKAPAKAAAAVSKLSGNPIRKSRMDHCYDGGVFILLAVTIAAMAASLAQF